MGVSKLLILFTSGLFVCVTPNVRGKSSFKKVREREEKQKKRKKNKRDKAMRKLSTSRLLQKSLP
nr:hypothetical protein [uncultured bacterium]